MANEDTLNLPVATSVSGAEWMAIVQNGVDRRATTGQFQQLISNGVTSIDVSGGATSMCANLGAPVESFGIPATSHLCRIPYSSEPFLKRNPPSCATCEVGFKRTRLWSGSRGFSRRPNRSRVRAT